jgi:hypothetical protein
MSKTTTDLHLLYQRASIDDRYRILAGPASRMREGEIVWMWTGPTDAFDLMVTLFDSSWWAAGLVCAVHVEIPDTFPFSRDAVAITTYTIELCEKGKPVRRYLGVKQDFVIPWLARKEFIYAPSADSKVTEHPSVAYARTIVETCCLLDPDTLTTDPEAPDKTFFNWIFLGAEKLYIGEGLRVRLSDKEDEHVFIPDHIYLMPVGDSVTIRFIGYLYTWVDLPGSKEQTADQSQGIHAGKRLALVKDGDICVTDVLGRLYDDEAIRKWRQHEGKAATLGTTTLLRCANDRASGYSWTYIKALNVTETDRVIPATNRFDSASAHATEGEQPIAEAHAKRVFEYDSDVFEDDSDDFEDDSDDFEDDSDDSED